MMEWWPPQNGLDFYKEIYGRTLAMFIEIIPPMKREVLEPYKIFQLKQEMASVLWLLSFPIHKIPPDV